MNPRPQTAEQQLSRYRELIEEAQRCAARALSQGEAPLAAAWEELAAEIRKAIADAEERP